MENSTNFSSAQQELPRGTDTVIMGILNVIEVLVGIPGNFLVIMAVLLSRKLQTASNAFIVNLAVADLLTCMVLPLHIVGDWARYYFSSLEPICQVALGITHICVGCSVLTLASIALNRFLLVLTPRSTYQTIYRPRHLVIWIILLWSISGMMSILPPLAFNIGKFGFDLPTQSCLSLTDFPTSKQYEYILVLGFYPIPLAVIVVCYTGILIKVVKHNRRLKQNKEQRGNSKPKCSNNRIRISNGNHQK
ncbi:G-protein coupled receptor moody [Holothuria leucospilota]|uniref:G-protein coupled receptor moody n=1 Tax=Holothuria leucospilota TaxID=206669 RepID=A0A9Q1BV08_HOLLE|nr:G-protein coupled receptor moody [Holothuria leucospilota]